MTPQMVADVIKERAGEDTRVTILGHVQRGGAPERLRPLDAHADGARGGHGGAGVPSPGRRLAAHRASTTTGSRKMPLMEAVAATKAIPEMIEAGEYAEADGRARGDRSSGMVGVFEGIAQPEPMMPGQGTTIGVMHAGGLAPGMNAAVRAAVRFGISRGHKIVGIHGGFPGLLDGPASSRSDWEAVEGWNGLGGAELGTSRTTPPTEEFAAVGEAIAAQQARRPAHHRGPPGVRGRAGGCVAHRGRPSGAAACR